MNAERLLEHFDRIADAPDAVPRLRRFILDLAVRGKLVEQDPNDEPACQLLQRIQAEKLRLVKAGKIRNEKPMPVLTDEDLPFWIPDNWQWSQIAQVGLVNPRNSADSAAPASFVPMTLISAEYGVQSKCEVRPWGEIKNGFTHFAEGDAAIAKITPCFQNGKSTVFRNLSSGIGAGTTELHVVRPLFVDPNYLLIFVKCPHFIETGIPRMTGTAGQKRVPTEYFANAPLPLPPLAEQQRIVAMVDELMGLCDRLEAAQRDREGRRDRLAATALDRLNRAAPAVSASSQSPAAAPALRTAAAFVLEHLPRLTTRPEQMPQFRQTILNLAVRGQLVRQDAGDEPIQLAVRRALDRRAALVRAKRIRHKKLDDSAGVTKSADLPTSWAVERLGNLVDPENTISYGVLVPGNDVADGVPFVRVQDLSLTSHAERPNKTISRDIEKAYSRTRLRGGEILLCVVGATIGRLGIAPTWWAGANIARAVARIMPVPEVSQDYLLVVLRGQPVQSYFVETTRTLAQPTLNVGAIEQTPIPLPPLAEQQRIVVKVNELMALCDRLEAQLTAARSDSRRLLEALLDDALAPAVELASR